MSRGCLWGRLMWAPPSCFDGGSGLVCWGLRVCLPPELEFVLYLGLDPLHGGFSLCFGGFVFFCGGALIFAPIEALLPLVDDLAALAQYGALSSIASLVPIVMAFSIWLG